MPTYTVAIVKMKLSAKLDTIITVPDQVIGLVDGFEGDLRSLGARASTPVADQKIFVGANPGAQTNVEDLGSV